MLRPSGLCQQRSKGYEMDKQSRGYGIQRASTNAAGSATNSNTKPTPRHIEGYFISTDEKGHMRLMCLNQVSSGRVYVSKSTIDEFSALPCTGEKLVCFRNHIGRVDAVLYLDELDELELIDNGDGRLHYLVGHDSIKYPRRSWHRSAWPD